MTSSLPLRVGVGWQRRCKTCHPLRKLGNQVTFFPALAFFAVTVMVVELDHIVRGEKTSILRKVDDHTTWCLNGETPMRQCVSRGCLWKWRYQKIKQLIVGCHPNAR